MKKFLTQAKKITKKMLPIILIILFFSSLIIFISLIKIYSKSGDLSVGYKINGHHAKKYHPIKINSIEPWMTFSYINIVFKINPDYLKNALVISDSRYPNIRIDTYAKKNNMYPLYLLQNIEKEITNYSANK